jgi:hypothetical protein
MARQPLGTMIPNGCRTASRPSPCHRGQRTRRFPAAATLKAENRAEAGPIVMGTLRPG